MWHQLKLPRFQRELPSSGAAHDAATKHLRKVGLEDKMQELDASQLGRKIRRHLIETVHFETEGFRGLCYVPTPGTSVDATNRERHSDVHRAEQGNTDVPVSRAVAQGPGQTQFANTSIHTRLQCLSGEAIRMLKVLCALGGTEVPEVLLQRLSSPRSYWEVDGEVGHASLSTDGNLSQDVSHCLPTVEHLATQGYVKANDANVGRRRFEVLPELRDWCEKSAQGPNPSWERLIFLSHVFPGRYEEAG